MRSDSRVVPEGVEAEGHRRGFRSAWIAIAELGARIRIRRLLVHAFVIGILAILGFRLVRAWEEVTAYPFEYSIPGLGAATLLLLLGLVVSALGWWYLLRGFGHHASGRRAIEVYALTNATKYAPGGIWPVVGKVGMLEGHRPTIALTSSMDMAFKAGSALFVAALFGGAKDHLWGAIAGSVACLVMMSPRIIAWGMALVDRISRGRIGPVDMSRATYGTMVGTFGIYGLSWVTIGLGFAVLVQSTVSDAGSTAFLTGGFVFAWAVGFLVVFVPAGAGIREALIASLLAGSVGEGMAILLAIVARLWWLLGDLLFFLLGVGLRQGRGVRKDEGEA